MCTQSPWYDLENALRWNAASARGYSATLLPRFGLLLLLLINFVCVFRGGTRRSVLLVLRPHLLEGLAVRRLVEHRVDGVV